jgi:DNA-binding IclR family transcriptional regulator
MARRPDGNRLEQIARYLENHPQSRPSEIARALDLHPSTVIRLLPTLEKAGILLIEDEQGRLSLFRRPWARR